MRPLTNMIQNFPRLRFASAVPSMEMALHVKVLCMLIVVSLLFGAPSVRAVPAGIERPAFPSLDDKALGHIRHILRIIDQVSGVGDPTAGLQEGQEYDTSSSLQLLYFVYALGLSHYHYTPAYRELYQETMDRVIQKMLGKESPGNGEPTPSGSEAPDPEPKLLGGAGPEPLARGNVMYSGHLLATVGYYTMLFGDRKYTESGSLQFDHEAIFPGWADPKKYRHDFTSLARLIHEQYIASPMGFICEPNAIFMFCNGHTFYGFRFHDHIFGTNWMPTVAKRFKEAWKEKGGFLDANGHFVEAYLIAQDFIWVQPSAYFDAWAGAWMHGWNRDAIESLYPGHAKRWVKGLPDGTAYVEPRPQSSWSLQSTSDFGHFAFYSAELGDRKTVDAMLAYAEKHLNPTWEDGAYFFPRNDDLRNEEGLPVLVTPLAGNALLALARINVPNGLATTLSKPFDQAHFEEPYVDRIDYPNVLVRQAVYDADESALIIRLTRGEGRGRTTFRVNRLDAGRDWEILANDSTVGWLRTGTVQAKPGAPVALRLSEDGALEISLDLNGEARILVKTVN
jgi:hypothetical protein